MVKDLDNEVWMCHPTYTDYAASNYGRIKSLGRIVMRSNGRPQHCQEQLIKLQTDKDGYLWFNIKKNGKHLAAPRVHRFAYECFNQCIILDDLEINHIDCNRSNNQIFNLELLDHQSNIDYSKSKQVGQYDLEGNLVKIWKSTREAEREGGFSHGNVSACCNGKYITKLGNNVYKHFIWQYI